MLSVNQFDAGKTSGLSSLNQVKNPSANSAGVQSAGFDSSSGSASAVVELSGSITDKVSSERRAVTKENAAQLSFDIAGMLGKSFGVQTNISACDAARLLAD